MTTSTHTMISPAPNDWANHRGYRLRRLIAGCLSLWLAVSPLITLRAAYAGPVADAAAPAGNRPQVTATQSGLPLVNIAAPNGAGISHNRYQRFDVDPVGLILNNSTRAASSQLGGQIGANPNFNGRSANLIVNEVTSAIPSNLNGPLAVFGDPAKLVIANPNGITCNGCGFLNTPWVALTTGRVQFLTAPGGVPTTPENGAAVAFDVRGGTIRIEGQGLASPLERLDLIAQTLNVNAPITISGALNLLAGRQTVAADDLAVSANGADNSRAAMQSDDPAASEFAVDASVFGAMTAGQIRIVSTPAGMGVRADSRLAAQAGDLVISADGDVRLRQATANRDVALTAGGSLSTGEQIAAARDLSVTVAALDNRNARISAGGDATVTAAAMDNTAGTIQAAGQLDIALSGASIDLAAAATGTLAGGSGLAVAAREIANTGSFEHGAALSLAATDRIVNSGALTAGGDLTLSSDVVDNRGIAQSLARLLLSATRAGNAVGARMEATSDLALSAVSFDNHGDIVSRRDLAARVTTLTNSGLIHAGNDAAFDLGAASGNAGGTLTAARDLALRTDVTAAVGGSVGAGRDLILAFNDYTHGHDTDFRAGRDLGISAANFVNTGLLEAPNDLTLAASRNLTNSGTILARNDIALNVGGSFTNSAGSVEAGRDLAVTTTDLSNGGSTTTTQYVAYSLAGYVDNVLTYVTDPLAQLKLFNEYPPDWFWKNSRVTLNNRYSLYLDSGLDAPIFYLTLTRPGNPGTLAAGRDLSIAASGTVTNRASILTAGHDVTIAAAQFHNLAGQAVDYGNVWAGGGSHQLKAFGNASATVQAGGNAVISAATQTNTGLIQANAVYLGGNLVNGITDYQVQTPAPRLPDAVIDLATQNLPAGSLFTPGGATLFSSASRLALLTPGPDSLNSLLPPELRTGNIPYLFDGWLEQQALRQAALNETGRVLFLAGLDSLENGGDGLSPETRQRQLLHAAAARFALSEGLKLGVALTPEQLAKLTEPLLWYVEQTVTGPDGKPYAALVPRLYLPQASREQLVNLGGGSLVGNDVQLAGDKITNTGYLQANRLTVDADELRNEKRSAWWGRGTENVKGGYIEYWGDRVQPGGFISAAELSLNVKRIHSVSGEFYAQGKEISPDLAQQLGSRYTRQENQDHSYSRFHADSSAQTKQIAAMAVAVAVSVWLGPQISGWVGSSFGTTAGSTFAAATNTAAAGIGNVALSGALTGMAGSAASGLINGNFDLNDVLKSGVTSGLTAGLTQWAGQALGNSTLLNTQQVGDALKAGETATKLTDKLIGYTVRAGLTAGVNQMVYGKDAGGFGEAFVQSFVASGAADAANWVGGNTPSQSLQNIASHAVLGCAAAVATGGNCGAGAVGGAASALLAPAIDQLASLQDPQMRAAVVAGLSTFAGGVIAQAAGYDGVTAAQAAQNEVLSNYLSHRQVDQLAKELKQCGSGDSACANAVLGKYIEISEKQSGLAPSQLDAYYAQVDAWAAQASADCQTSACRQQVDAWRTITKLTASGSEEQTLMNLRGLQLIVKSPAGVALSVGGDVLMTALNFAPVLAGVRPGAVGAEKTPPLLNGPITISEKGMAHVVERHTVNDIAKFAGKSKFNEGENLPALINSGTQQRMVQQANGNFARTWDVGRPIGVDRVTGQQTSVMTVITRPNGELVTAFPGRP